MVFVRTLGFEYTFCDRFCPEQIYYYTQTVQPGAMEEDDPVKRLSMFSVNIKCFARIHIMKSLLLAKGQILKENERQARADVANGFDGLGKVLKQSIQKRLQHYTNPIVTHEPPTPEVMMLPGYRQSVNQSLKESFASASARSSGNGQIKEI